MACVCAVLIAVGQTLPPLLAPAANFSFPTKQTLTYAVDWRVFPAGTATFHLEQVGGMQHVVATGESIGAVNLLFRVNDRFESYLQSRHRLLHQLCQAASGGQTATGQVPCDFFPAKANRFWKRRIWSPEPASIKNRRFHPA